MTHRNHRKPVRRAPAQGAAVRPEAIRPGAGTESPLPLGPITVTVPVADRYSEALPALMAAVEASREATRDLGEAVRAARLAGVPWHLVGALTELSPDGARSRWGRS